MNRQTPLVAVGATPQADRLLTPDEVAARLAVSRSMAYKLLRTGKLVPVYIGRLPRILASDLDGYIERQRRREP
jgi:excisionase family DNA binding protein